MADIRSALAREALRTSIPQSEIVAFISLGTRDGLTVEEVEGGLYQAGRTAHEAGVGRDLEAAGGMAQLHLEMMYEDGRPDVGAYLIALSGKIAPQADPYTRDRICEVLGCTAILPVLIKGPSAIVAAMRAAEARGIPSDNKVAD